MIAKGFMGFRIDDRMLHGIVATSWVPHFQATRAMVIDDAASTNEIMRQSMKMACPAGVALSVISVEKAVANITADKYAAQRVFCVFRTIDTAYALFKAGIEMPEINLGNITQNLGETTVLGKTVRINEDEKAKLREMRDAGIHIIVQFRTDDTAEDVSSLLD